MIFCPNYNSHTVTVVVRAYYLKILGTKILEISKPFQGLTRKYLKDFSEVGTYLNLKFEFQVFPSLLENTQNLLRLILDHQSFGIFAKLKCRPMNMLRETRYFRSDKIIFLSNLSWIVLISQSPQPHHFCLF